MTSQPSPAPILQFPIASSHPSSLIPHLSSNLPLQFTRFFGREEEIARLRERLLLEETRLVTLTGAGGGGKTRLAIEVGNTLQEEFTGGVWFVPLADLSDPRLIAGAVRDALRLPRSPGVEPLEQVVGALSQWERHGIRSLMVLDNFEQLAAGGALVALTLLKRVPSLTCLVTSRRRLNVAGEREFPVLPLPTPTGSPSPEPLMQYASVQLFVDRAQMARPDFQVTARNASSIAELGRRLEGIPLAIELAAARMQVFSPSQMIARLTRRFDLLTQRRVDTTARHRSLWAAMEWSYDLLSPELQRFFARLSVFRSGWSVEAAAAILDFGLPILDSGADTATIQNPKSKIQNEVLDYLAQLRSHSLVLAEEGEPEMRYRMLETLREFGAEQLTAEERSALSQRHAYYFLSLAEEAKPHLEAPEQKMWLERLETEHDNLRAALQWCVDYGEGEKGMRMGGSLWHLWSEHGHLSEGREWLAKLVALPGAEARTEARAHALNGAGILAYRQGDFTAARVYFEEALAIRREREDQRGVGGVLNNLANVVSAQGDQMTAQRLYEQALHICHALGRRDGEAVNLYNLGRVIYEQGDYATARTLHEQALAINRELGNRAWEAYDLMGLGVVAWHQGDYTTAWALCQQGLALFREFGNRWGIAQALRRLGMVSCRQGDTTSARSSLNESLTLYRELGDKRGIASVLEGMAELALFVGNGRRAVLLWGAAESLREAIGAPQPPCDRPDYERHVVAARAALGGKTFAATWAQGRALTLEQAIADALGETA
jgi:predicted ATPase